jgi:hypothetical protein
MPQRREATMNPWITGRIIEQMQHEARKNGEQARLGRQATHAETLRDGPPEPREPRRTRIGLALARVGLRIAGRSAEPWAGPVATPPSARADEWSNPWTTCGATSTSPH